MMRSLNLISKSIVFCIVAYSVCVFLIFGYSFMYLTNVKLKQEVSNIELIRDKKKYSILPKSHTPEYGSTWVQIKKYSASSGIDALACFLIKDDKLIRVLKVGADKTTSYDKSVGSIVEGKLLEDLKTEVKRFKRYPALLRSKLHKGKDQNYYLINFYLNKDYLGDTYLIAVTMKPQKIFAFALESFGGELFGRIDIIAITFFIVAIFWNENSKKKILLSIKCEMTGFYTKNYLEVLQRKIQKSSCSWGIVYIDLDNLKLMNDKLGHKYGDNYIIRFSKFLKRSFREKEAYFVRVGGDEFVLCLPNLTKEELKNMSERLETRKPEDIEFSLGAVHIDSSLVKGIDLDIYIHEADKMMYSNKRKNKIC